MEYRCECIILIKMQMPFVGFVAYFIRLVIDTSTSSTIIIHLNANGARNEKRKKNEPDKNTKHAATHEIDGGVRGLLTSISVPKGKQHLEEKCFIVVCFFWYVLHFSHSFLRFLAPVDFLLLSLSLCGVCMCPCSM